MERCSFLTRFLTAVLLTRYGVILMAFSAGALLTALVLYAGTTQAAKVERDGENVSVTKGLEYGRIDYDGVFRGQEFRTTIKFIPHWSRVLVLAERQIEAYYKCQENCSSAALNWRKIIRQSKGLPRLDQLKNVNFFFNRWPYRLDIDVYGMSDFWATPDEFMLLSGDCEDYSIAKYYALRELGFAIGDMRIVMIKDIIRNISHAVLSVKLGEEIYILDNLTDMLLSHLKYEHYVPQYSFNEFYGWIYVLPIMSKQQLSGVH